ncbi:MAG: hypothetical protein PHR77_16015 [Kiritimatiellae bacterium]|nr:hypothetical protein [Kiritimatiellia bacterium]
MAKRQHHGLAAVHKSREIEHIFKIASCAGPVRSVVAAEDGLPSLLRGIEPLEMILRTRRIEIQRFIQQSWP